MARTRPPLHDTITSSSSGSNAYDVNEEPESETGYTSTGGLDDNDEIHGAEQEAAISSPPKGKKRLTSSVGHLLIPCVLS